MLQFKKATERVSTLETIGTVASFVGKDGSYALASIKNFNGTIDENGNKVLKKVSIKLMNKDGDYEYVNCSKPVGDWLREVTGQELKSRIDELALMPILKLPQVDKEGNPIMIIDEETGEEKQLILYSISFNGNTDMSATSVTITDEMLNKEIAGRAINFEDLIAI